jgi:hypothetical protein
MSKLIISGRLNGAQRNRMKSLFDMMYTPRELSDELGINIDKVYTYVTLGCPHERDSKKRISINGKAFADWYIENYKRIKLQEDETFCLTCRKAVKLYKSKNKVKGKFFYIKSVCPICGRNLVKIINNKRQRI